MMIKKMFCLFFIKTQVVGTHLNTSYGCFGTQRA